MMFWSLEDTDRNSNKTKLDDAGNARAINLNLNNWCVGKGLQLQNSWSESRRMQMPAT